MIACCLDAKLWPSVREMCTVRDVHLDTETAQSGRLVPESILVGFQSQHEGPRFFGSFFLSMPSCTLIPVAGDQVFGTSMGS
jgi:hypothetical protein